jgi:outer membrane protein insertion porin family
MRIARTVALAALVLVVIAVPSIARAQALPQDQPEAQPGTIEEILLQGNIRMTERAFVEALGVRVGDPYDQGVLVSAFRRLWDMGLFNDLIFEVEDGDQGGKVLIVKLTERPTLASVTYQDNKVVNRTQIEDRLIELDQGLEIGQPLDMKSVFIVESIIRDMLGEKGYLEAKVAAEPRVVTEGTSYSIHFFIQTGGKTRIRKIEFTGNEVFKDKQLRGTLTLTQGRKWYWPWSKKNLYHPVKWDQDSGAVRELYQNAGYLDVKVRPPIIEPIPEKKKKKKKAAEEEVAAPEEVEVISPKKIEKVVKAQQNLDAAEQDLRLVLDMEVPDGLSPRDEDKWYEKQGKQEEKSRKKVNKAKKELEKAETAAQPPTKKSWVTLTVPVDEGQQYSMGEITVEGNTVYEDEQLIALIPLRKGLVLSAALLKMGIDRITRVYGDRGYLYANVVRQIQRHEGEPVADVLISIEEDQAYFVDTIEFKGNTSTKDKVLRREFRLLEGELFSQTKLDLSMRKVNQLGYVAVPEDPVIEPIEGENKIRISIGVEEQGRNEIQVGGGYSGTDGAFFTGFYSTRNFLGRGQILTVSLQIGGRTNRYGISFIEPWFLGRPRARARAVASSSASSSATSRTSSSTTTSRACNRPASRSRSHWRPTASRASRRASPTTRSTTPTARREGRPRRRRCRSPAAFSAATARTTGRS